MNLKEIEELRKDGEEEERDRGLARSLMLKK